MINLFPLVPGQTFSETLRGLHDGHLAEIFGRTILGRAYDYTNAIESLEISPGSAEAEIYGTEPYETSIECRLGVVFGSCSCPYDSACKHLAALLLYLRDEAEPAELDNIEPLATRDSKSAQLAQPFDFDAYLDALDASELRTLVRQFAPDAYRRALALQHASGDPNDKGLASAGKRLRDLLNKASHYDPDVFEAALMKQLDSLRPYWLVRTAEVLRLLGQVFSQIDEAMQEGYLYNDYGDATFEGDDLGQYLAEFAAAQPAESLADTLREIHALLPSQTYGFATHVIADIVPLLSAEKCRRLLPFFLETGSLAALEDRDQRVVWQYLKPLLDPDEQLVILALLTLNPFFVLELADLLEREGDIDTAIQELDRALHDDQPGPAILLDFGFYSADKSGLYERRIDLEQRYCGGAALGLWTKRYVTNYPRARSLHYVLPFQPRQRSVLEKLLRQKNLPAFVQFLEDEKRLDEVMACFADNPSALSFAVRYDFFKRHKKTFPGAATDIFETALHQRLPETGERAYQVVVDALVQLKAVEPPGVFKARVQLIRETYRRRGKLLEMMDRAKLD